MLSPDQVAFFEGPGTRIAPGEFRGLVNSGDLLFVRETHGDPNRVLVIDVQKRSLCALDGAARLSHWDTPWLAYGENDGDGVGLLRFAKPDCTQLAASLPRASLPLDTTLDGEAIVVSGGDLLQVDPESAEVKLLATSYRSARSLTAPGDSAYVWLIHADGQLIEFDPAWQELARYGHDVTSVARLPGMNGVLVEEGAGVTFVSLTAGNLLKPLGVAAQACALSAASPDFAAFESPCESGRLALFAPSTGVIELGNLELDASRVAPLLLDAEGASSARRLRLFFLRDVDAATSLGRLEFSDFTLRGSSEFEAAAGAAGSSGGADALRAGAGGAPSDSALASRIVGERADLAWVRAASARDSAYVLVDVDEGVGRLLRVPVAGEPEQVLTRVPSSARNQSYYARGTWLLAGSDGTRADLVRLCRLAACSRASEVQRLEVETLSEGVPLSGFASSFAQDDLLILHDYDGAFGTLSLESGPEIATRVARGAFVGLYPIMERGAAYLSDYDAARGSGALYYYNQLIDARGLVARDVSEVSATGWPYAGLIYLVPAGERAGIWFARGK